MKSNLIFFLSLIFPASTFLALGLHFNSFTLKEETNSYSIHVNYPHSGDKKIEALLRNYIDDYVISFKKDFKEKLSPNWKNNLYISYERSNFSKNIVSYIFYIYTFTGGAHGNTSIITKNFNIETLDEINLNSVFEEDENYLEKISKITINHLKDNLISEDATSDSIKFSEEWIEEGASQKKENYQRFTLTPKEIVFYFEQYQVAPYSDGVQEVRIPFYEIDNFLKPPFSKNKEVKTPQEIKVSESSISTEKNCTWKDFNAKSLGLYIMIQDCKWKEMSPIFTESGNAIIQTPEKFKGSKNGGYKVIEVYKKKETDEFEEVINKQFISKLSRAQKNHCIAKQSYFILDDKSKINYVIEPDNALQEKILQETPEGQIPKDPCGEYGISGNGFIRYFEYHPEESKTKFVFVRVGQDAPLFDEKNIKFISN